MAESAKATRRPPCTICLPITEDEYRQIMNSWPRFRLWLQRCHAAMPELFPDGFGDGFGQKDARTSKKMALRLWRITLPSNGRHYSIRPSFATPHLTARTDDVAHGLFLRKFGVPYWALAHVFGRSRMSWYRLEHSLGRNSVVGTTVRRGAVPEHLVADEHHQTCNGDKVYLATTVGAGCCLGAAVASSASSAALTEAYRVFHDEAKDVAPNYEPKTVNTDGWKGTIAAWRSLFVTIVTLRCFLHGWLKIRDRGKHLACFLDLGKRVWQAYHALDRATFRRRLRALRKWSMKHLSPGIVLDEVLDLCGKAHLWVKAYAHPDGHRTSNMLDRVMRGMGRYFDQGQHLHGSVAVSEQRARAWALLHNFTPWSPQAQRRNQGHQSPAQRLNRHRYHTCWLQNLLISASLGGYRNSTPQIAG
jgi:hypothetical protein